jgi:AraC family transcriptional activator FtrA
MIVTSPGRRHTVSVLAFDGMAPFELGSVVEVFGLPRPELDIPWYDLRVCSLERGPMRAVGGFTMAAEHGLDAFASADTVMVVAVPDVRRDPPPEVVAALREAHARGARVVSICSGAFALAAAGLLDGREATTHWRYADLLRRRFPDVRVTPDVLYVDGDDVLTGAGSAAGLDMCLHLVRKDHGARVANMVARRLVVPPHREGGQAQFIRRPVPAGGLPSTAAARAWALDRLDRPLALRELAARESMSVRTFTRRFREEMGISPGQWLTQQRVERTRHLLETTDLTVDRIAELTGFGTAASLRQRLRETLGVSPSAYRRTFRFTKN